MADKMSTSTPNRTVTAADVPTGLAWFRQSVGYYTGLMDAAATKQYEADSARRKELKQCTQCEEYRDWILRYSPTVRFMQEQVAKVGGNLDRNNIYCRHCDQWKGGGFHPTRGILLCQNRIIDRSHLEDTIAHELVHAYDQCKFEVDWLNLRHHACSEIRASSLSGECRMTNEFFRNRIFKITRQHQECVRRRAVLSVTANPNCADAAMAEKVVDLVWDSCFNDTRPYDEIYR
ncbi:uncharacterized protein V1510DRAFT_414981 [Dipodascopsis tothii]|uniref:uncharacterized protein n=1 Tax=Dipodascopsis tothii TaxID=44089 RepID=UPI0034CDCC58